MNETIKQLLALQEKDSEADRQKAELAAIPKAIAALNAEIATAKANLETAKKDLTHFQLQKKEKDAELEVRESAIRKHTGELNAVKSNEAYKALMGEIEKAKTEKSALEDEILQLMEKIDEANKIWKGRESEAKGFEDDKKQQIRNLEDKKKNLEETIARKLTEREAEAEAMPRNLIEPYERIRKAGRTTVIVPLRNDQCMGCHMKVSTSLAREVLRTKQQLLSCESCARLVYLEEAAPTPNPSI